MRPRRARTPRPRGRGRAAPARAPVAWPPILLHRVGDDHRVNRPLPPPACTVHAIGPCTYDRRTVRRGFPNHSGAAITGPEDPEMTTTSRATHPTAVTKRA